MAEICGYDNESVAFWHKYGRLGEKMRLVSTDFEANLVFRNIPRDRVIEVYFEHLDSYIGMDISNNVEQNKKEGRAEYSSSDDDFEDSDNDLSDEHDILERSENGTREYEVSETARKKMAHEDGDSDCVNSEGFKSLESDSNSDGMNLTVFNPNTDGLYPILALELIFKSKKEFKNAVITHEVSQGKYIKWRKNDKERIRAVCAKHPDCDWEIMASKMYRDCAFQVKTYNPIHKCKNWNHVNKTITSLFIVRKYLDAIKTNRNWKISEFRDHVSIQLTAHVTLSKCRRAKKKAIAMIDGDISDQFKLLWNYCNEIMRTNPNTSVYMNACKEGFKSGCRKIVGVDGCWLKGPMYGTQLLTAVGLDPNNNIYPIAYAVVEKENRESWAWFLDHLKLDLEIDDGAHWTFMSDKQKGLIEAFNDILPLVAHRFCVRHLHSNFKRAGFCGDTLRNALWKAASATTVRWFGERMVEIFYLDPEAAIWLRDKSPSEWSKSHFSEDAKCDTLVNNICECFNNMILDARDKPIITLLEKIRYMLMTRMQENRDKSVKWSSDDICPRIKNVLCKSQVAAAEYIPRKSNEWNYELIGASITDIWAVDLLNRKCSCRKWNLTRLPCKYAISAIWAKNDEISSYINDCYKVETYRRIYEFAILPMNGQSMWP
ncbi:uncharacterized protein LOC125863780 [Solanum stenotomum]|uniref:uncharacterized protein LOC125863780 n=1 Tax=Solanum stenotomum TaxID=172797 RepID=UPI0020CFF73F|nr:uncharacterized protein LOC125863780 [Solanum stenotomum]